MTRLSQLSSPFLLGFEEMERLLERVTKTSGDGYPPYNIERISDIDQDRFILRITLAVAGFDEEDLDITVENNQLVITGQKQKEENSDFLHRGIALRQFKRNFILAEGIEIINAQLKNGLLSIDLHKPEIEVKSIKIKINT